ncbi:hypothetical protein RSAG8_07912, partial [Rhizoctonia solani AG-8 WAC10335]
MRVVTVPVRRDNYAYILIDEATHKAAAVDPFDVAKVRAQAEKEGVELTALITTHHRVHRPLWRQPGISLRPSKRSCVRRIGQNSSIDSPCQRRRHIFRRGEYPSQVPSYPMPYPGLDLLLRPGHHSTGAKGGVYWVCTVPEMHRALSYLGTLPDETVVYTGHEYTKITLAFGAHIDPYAPGINKLRKLAEESVTTGKSTIGDEKQWSVFMRLDSEAVRAATKAQDDLEAMVKLREMKNSFRG